MSKSTSGMAQDRALIGVDIHDPVVPCLSKTQHYVGYELGSVNHSSSKADELSAKCFQDEGAQTRCHFLDAPFGRTMIKGRRNT
jgi:hypothetical protein